MTHRGDSRFVLRNNIYMRIRAERLARIAAVNKILQTPCSVSVIITKVSCVAVLIDLAKRAAISPLEFRKEVYEIFINIQMRAYTHT